MPRLLVIEDERKILRALERGLENEGYEVMAVANGEMGYQLAQISPFDCIILDLLLPGKHGLQILKDLRQAGQKVPVLILTARDTVQDRVMGLDGGADDYLVKPFAFAELLEYLLRHKNRIVTRDMLGRDVWKEPGHALTNVIDVFITYLRRKIEKPGCPCL